MKGFWVTGDAIPEELCSLCSQWSGPRPARVGYKREGSQTPRQSPVAQLFLELGGTQLATGNRPSRTANSALVVADVEQRGEGQWGRPFSHGWEAGRGEKTWPSGSNGRTEPACRGRAGKKEKLDQTSPPRDRGSRQPGGSF